MARTGMKPCIKMVLLHLLLPFWPPFFKVLEGL